MTTYRPPALCDSCKRVGRFGMTCDAFPTGIPQEILLNEVDHREPVEGDGGKQFLLDPRFEPMYKQWLQDHGKS